MSNRNSRIRALVNRGLRGGLLAGQHLGADEVHHLCELLDKEYEERDKILIRLREVIEDAIDGSHDDDLAEAHGLVLTMMGEKNATNT